MQKDSSPGFTLIELLVVITIIIILASIAFPVFTNVQERAKATQDMSNLRQIGLATQMYLNDNDNVLFDATLPTWMEQLHPKYLPAWKIFQSPFDKRSPSELTASAPISYGLNGNSKAGGTSIAGLSTDKITNPSAFIIFSPAQDSTGLVAFQGTSGASVTEYKGTSSPGGTAKGGTHSGRKRINALFADLHSESMSWANFLLDTDPNDSTAAQRWDP